MNLDDPHPGAGTTDRLDRKFNAVRAMLFAGIPPQLVKKYEAMFWIGAEAMFDVMATEIADLEEDEAMHETARLHNSIWRKAKTLEFTKRGR